MKKTLMTLVFLCTILAGSYFSGTENITGEQSTIKEPSEAEMTANLDKVLSNNKSLDIYHHFVESGLTKRNMVAEISTAETIDESKEFNISSMTIGEIDKKPLLKIIEFQSNEDAKKYYDEYKENSFYHENIYVSVMINVNQIEKYKKVVATKKAIK